jgi:hypothetical protein
VKEFAKKRLLGIMSGGGGGVVKGVRTYIQLCEPFGLQCSPVQIWFVPASDVIGRYR